MMYIMLPQRSIQWHVGEKAPISKCLVPLVLEVQADGHELDKIRREITDIPMSSQRVIKWRDDDARFIINNLDFGTSTVCACLDL